MDSELVVAPCSYEAAKHAIDRWHYSASMPRGKLSTWGVWEAGRYIGAVVFGRGAGPTLAESLGLDQYTLCELTRVALTDHTAPVSQLVAETIRQLNANSPRLRAVVSFADPSEGHHGGIYQAGNWIYLGRSSPSSEVWFGGRWQHTRNLRPTGWGTLPRAARVQNKADLPKRKTPGKHRYVYPLDKQTRRRLIKQAQPYPPAVEGSTVSRPANQPVSAGATPADRSTTL